MVVRAARSKKIKCLFVCLFDGNEGTEKSGVKL